MQYTDVLIVNSNFSRMCININTCIIFVTQGTLINVEEINCKFEQIISLLVDTHE